MCFFGFNVQEMQSFFSYHSYFYSVSAHCQNMLVSIISSAFGSVVCGIPDLTLFSHSSISHSSISSQFVQPATLFH